MTALSTVFEGETPKPESVVKEETPQLVDHTVKALMSDPKEISSNANAKEMLAFEQALISDKSKLDEFVEKGGEEWKSALEGDIDDTFTNLEEERKKFKNHPHRLTTGICLQIVSMMEIDAETYSGRLKLTRLPPPQA